MQEMPLKDSDCEHQPPLNSCVAHGFSHCSVNSVVPSSEVVSEAISIAKAIVANSPDAVQSTKYGLLLSQSNSPEEAFQKHTFSSESGRVYKGENIKVSGAIIDVV